MEKPQNQELSKLLIILVFLSLVSLAIFYQETRLEKIRACNALRTELTQDTFHNFEKDVQAKAVYVYDFSNNRELYSKNADVPLPLASLTKLMTVRIALKNNSLQDFYTVQKNDLDSDGFVGFVIGDSYRIISLVRAALISSSNDAAIMLARSSGLSIDSFLQVMNLEAQRLHLPSLHYTSVTGLDTDKNEATAVGDAKDVIKLLHQDYLDFPDVFSVSVLQDDIIAASNGRSISLVNTNTVINKLGLLVASKTGYTDVAGGNLAILWRDPNGDLLGAIVIGSTELGRFNDMIILHDGANEYENVYRLIPQGCFK